MLEYAGRITHSQDRCRIGFAYGIAAARRATIFMVRNGGNHQIPHVARQLAPDHRAAMVVCARGIAAQKRGICQHLHDMIGQSPGILERNDDAATFRENFLRLDVGCRQNGLAHADCIAEGARYYLGRIDIRRDIDVGSLEIVEQFLLFDISVDETHLFPHTQFVGQRGQALAETFALFADEVRVGRPQHDIERIGVPFDDGGHGPDHMINALVGCQQAEGQDDPVIFPSKARLHY